MRVVVARLELATPQTYIKNIFIKKAFGNFLYSIFMHRILLSTLPTELHHHPHDEGIFKIFVNFSENIPMSKNP